MPADRPLIPRALTIAGSDSGGGAGIEADLRTFAALGVWGTVAITSVTVQNTTGVSGVSDVPANVVGAQILAVASDIGVDAAKTGMLSSAAIIEAVADAIERAGIRALVVDPVSVSKHGDPLLRPDAVGALRGRIVPLAALVTPNLPEAAALAGFDVVTRDDMRRAADAILGLGASAVLVKGGHLESGDGRADDLFADRSGAAIAAHLALGRTVRQAAAEGKRFVTEAIRHSLALGRGIGPVDPAWRSVEEVRSGEP